MKHGKNPTLNQKKLIKLLGRNPDNWLVIRHNNNEIVIEHRHTGRFERYIINNGRWEGGVI